MATVRAYTTIEQSRKLAEILPIESADQTWARIAIAGANLDVPEEMQYRHNGDMPFQYYSGIGIPCWSLASLLELLPKRLEITDNVYELSVYFYGLYYWNIVNGNPCFEFKNKDNLVDACYEMIIRLHELNLL